MKNSAIIALRTLKQIWNDKRYIVSTLIGPLIVVYFLKIFMDSMPPTFPVDQYVMPIIAFVVYFLSFLLCSIVLIQERTKGTLERMFISGCSKTEVITGYTLGYTLLASTVTALVLWQTVVLFDLPYTFSTIMLLFGITWILSIASIMLGIFVSTFARTEAQLLPFIPLIALPSLFLSGLLVPITKLPTWAQWIAGIFPLSYANTLIQEIIKPHGDIWNVHNDLIILILFVGLFLFGASLTFRKID